MRHYSITLRSIIGAALATTLAFSSTLYAQEPVAKVIYKAPYTQYAQHVQAVRSPQPDPTLDTIIQKVPEPLRSEVAYMHDIQSGKSLYQKNSQQARPIASITKLMTALLVLEAKQPLDEVLEISDEDIDTLKGTRSRLHVGSRLTRAQMLHLALMSSENRAANALGRHYPGGLPAFVRAMNDKARTLGMRHTHFVEPTGLSSENVATPQDLVRLLQAAATQPLIHQYSTSDQLTVSPRAGRQLVFANTNRLVLNDQWDIQVSKTGFINEAGQCLVLLATLEGRQVAMVLMNSQGSYSRIADAVRLRRLIEGSTQQLALL